MVSIIPYAIRTWQGKIAPNPASWLLWSLIGFLLLLTYQSSGAKANAWPTIFGFANPTLITLILIKKRRTWKKFEWFEYVCCVTGLVSLVMWWWMRSTKELAQWALYVAILADACAAIPTIIWLWRFPDRDRPFAWGLFAVGYGLITFAISENTIANWILPLYMCFMSTLITCFLVRYRWRSNQPITEWI